MVDQFGPASILSSIALIISVAISLYYFRYLMQRREYKYEIERLNMLHKLEKENLELRYYDSKYSSQDKKIVDAQWNKTLMDSALSDFGGKLTTSIVRELDARIYPLESKIMALRDDMDLYVHKSAQKPDLEYSSNKIAMLIEKSDSDTPKPETKSSVLIKDISHALNTPLSHIEATLEVLIVRESDASNSGARIVEDMRSIRSSIGICKSYLAAFRQMVLLSDSSLLWNPESLKSSLESASQSYAKSISGLQFNIDIADNISGYSNNIVLSILLPLLENAIEASSDNDVVSISSLSHNLYTIITVTNHAKTVATPEQMFRRGFTTKEEHSGFGLSIVRSLTSTIPGAVIDARVSEHQVSFDLKLPLEHSDAS